MFFPLALPFFLSQARPSDDRYLLRFILSTLRQVRFGAGQKAAAALSASDERSLPSFILV